MNFEDLISEEIQNISKYFSFSFTKIWPLRKIILKISAFLKNNKICAEVAKSLPEYQLLNIPVGSWNGFGLKKNSDQPGPGFGFLKLSYQSGPIIGSEAGRPRELILVSSRHISGITSALL